MSSSAFFFLLTIMIEPKILHRYFRFNDGINVLNDQQLKFSRLEQYNDPFEFVPAASSELFSHAPDEMQRKLEEYVQTEEGKKKLQVVEDDIGWGDIAFGTLFTAGMLHFPIITSIIGAGLLMLNLDDDEKENILLYAQKYFPLFSSVRCCCFSQKADDILMWSHYAEQHKGIVVSFDPFVGYWPNEQFREVIYSNERLGLPQNDTDANGYVWQMLTSKAKCWEYEQEYRIIRFGITEKEYSIPICPESVKAIRLGIGVKEERRAEIINLRDNLYPNAVVYQAKMSRHSFCLDFEEL